MASVRRALTHPQREKMLEQMRRQEEVREDTVKQLSHERMLEANMNSDFKIEDRRHLRRQQIEQKEEEMLEAIERTEALRQVKQAQHEQEEKLALELNRIKLDQLRDEKMRQQIRESSLELRELEAKLKAAYMNKERAAQLAEKEALKYDYMSRDSEIARQMKEENERAAEAQLEREKEKYREQVRYQQELETQLEEKEKKRQMAYEEFLKEKLMIDEIVRKIYEEDHRERELQLHSKKVTQNFIEEFKRAREQWKVEEERRMEEENRRILEFAMLQQEREGRLMDEKQQKEVVAAKVQQLLVEKISKEQAEREEMERVRMELYLEEQEEEERQREKELIELKLRQRIELQDTHVQQMHYKALRQHAEREEEEQFKVQMLAKFAEDDRIEQMNAQKRRMKQLEHKHAVDELIQKRREQYAMDRERELDERRDEERMEGYRQQVIEQERQRLLQEHAKKLLGYLPKGVIRSGQDLEMLGGEFKEQYKSRQIDPFSDEIWNESFK